MIVVCDTSPVNYLVIIGEVDVLPKLFQDVYVPPEVVEEILHPRTPEVVRRWAEAPPSWLKVTSATTRIQALTELGPGELQAIALAKELRADWLLMDERDGTRFALRQGLKVVGTLAVLEQAANRKLLDLVRALDRLQKTTFRVSQQLIQAVLERNAARNIGE